MTNRNSSTGKSNSRSRRDDSLVARTGRTVARQPYTSAAIATGAITAVAAAAAGAFFFSRRDQSFRESREELGDMVKDGISGATTRVKEMVGGSAEQGSETRSQAEIAQEALTLKESGSADTGSTPQQSQVGSIAY